MSEYKNERKKTISEMLNEIGGKDNMDIKVVNLNDLLLGKGKIENPFLEALLDGMGIKVGKLELKESGEERTVGVSKKYNIKCPIKNNFNMNYNYSEFYNNMEEVCLKCDEEDCPNKKNKVERGLDILARNSIYPDLSEINKKLSSNAYETITPIQETHVVTPKLKDRSVYEKVSKYMINQVEEMYSYGDLIKILLLLSDLSLNDKQVVKMSDIEAIEFAEKQMGKNFIYKLNRLKDVVYLLMQERYEERNKEN